MLQQELWQTYQSKTSYHDFPHWSRISPSFLFITKITCSQLCAETTTRWSSLSKVTKPRERHSWVLPQRNSPKTCWSWGCQGSSSMFHLFPFSFGAGQNEARVLVLTKKTSFISTSQPFFTAQKEGSSILGTLSVAKPSLGDLSCLHSTLQQVIQLGRASGDLHLRWLRWSVYLVAFTRGGWPMTHRRLCTMLQGFNKNCSISNCNTFQTQVSLSWVWSQFLQHG